MINPSPLLPISYTGKVNQGSIAIWRPKDNPYLEVIDGHSSQSYQGNLHLHEDLEIAWKPQGLWYMVIRGMTHQITTGQVVLTAPEEPHVARSIQGESALSSYIGLRFQTAFLSSFAAEISVTAKDHLFTFSSAFIEDPHFSSRLYSLHQGLVKNSLTPLQQDGLIQYIITYVLRYSRGSLEYPSYEHESLIIQKIKSYIHDHYQEPIRLQHLAELTNMSAFYLNRVFASHVGFPPHAFQLQIRISRAKLLLAQGHPLSEVALQTGFTSQSHLGLYFKRFVGLTPGQYIKARSTHS